MAGAVQNDVIVLGVASACSGVCSRRKLLAAGLSDSALKRRVRRGLLRPVAAGLYVVDKLVDRRTPLHLATIAWPDASLSHQTAADMHGFTARDWSSPVHVSVRHGRHVGLPGVRVHQSRTLDESDIIAFEGFRVTTIPRTIVDLAATTSEARLKHLIQTLIRDGRFTDSDRSACLASTERRGVTGTDRLRKALLAVSAGEPIAASKLESMTRELLHTGGFVGFRSQVKPPWYDGRRGIVDFANAELGIVVEADGRRWHQREQDMVEDRRRDRSAAAHGWVVIRVTWDDIKYRPAATVAELQAIISRRSQERAA